MLELHLADAELREPAQLIDDIVRAANDLTAPESGSPLLLEAAQPRQAADVRHVPLDGRVVRADERKTIIDFFTDAGSRPTASQCESRMAMRSASVSSGALGVFHSSAYSATYRKVRFGPLPPMSNHGRPCAGLGSTSRSRNW